ncbi:877_t:CDS:1, partial [Gigaspora rosea]
MNNIISKNKPVKVRKRVQRKTYRYSRSKAYWYLAASRHFGIDQSMVSRWKNSKEKFNNVISGNQRIGAGRVSFYPAAKEELIKWFNELRRMGIAVTA